MKRVILRGLAFVVASASLIVPAHAAIITSTVTVSANAAIDGSSYVDPFTMQDAANFNATLNNYTGTKSASVVAPDGAPAAAAAASLTQTYHNALLTTGHIDTTFHTVQSATSQCAGSDGCANAGAGVSGSSYTEFTLDGTYQYEITSSALFTPDPGTSWNSSTTTSLRDLDASAMLGEVLRTQSGSNPAHVVSAGLTGLLQPGHYFFLTSGSVGLGSDVANALSGDWSGHLTLTAVPLPAAGWLLFSGLAGVAALVRRRRPLGAPGRRMGSPA